MNATWYEMYLAIGMLDIKEHPQHGDLFNACVIREASGILLGKDNDNPFDQPKEEKLNFTGRAMVGLNVNGVDWLQLTSPDDPIPTPELEEMYFKLKIYACDDLDGKDHTGR